MDSKTFKLDKNYQNCGNLYTKCSHTFNKGLTILVGCNGSGKSSTLSQIKSHLRRNGDPYFMFDNAANGGSNMYQRLLDGMYSGGTEAICNLACSSEGEKIQKNLEIKAKSELLKALRKAKDNSKDMFVLCDSIDSGASIDNIIEIKDFFRLLIRDQKERNGIDVFVIAAANSYEMANGESCYDVNHNKYITFKDYDDYKRFILKSRGFKERRLNAWFKKQKELDEKSKEVLRNESGPYRGAGRSKEWKSQ